MDAIYQTLLGGALALAGSSLGPFFQRRHERWKARREDEKFLREKAEELFDELDRVGQQAAQASVRSMQMISNKSLEAIPVPDLGKIRAIATMYFPTTTKILESFEKSHSDETRKIFDEIRESVDRGRADPDEIKALTVLITATYQSLASECIKKIRIEVAQTVPLLHSGKVGK